MSSSHNTPRTAPGEARAAQRKAVAARRGDPFDRRRRDGAAPAGPRPARPGNRFALRGPGLAEGGAQASLAFPF